MKDLGNIPESLYKEGQMLNITITPKKTIKRVGWKSFKGMVFQLKRQNEILKKLGMTADFKIRLPLK